MCLLKVCACTLHLWEVTIVGFMTERNERWGKRGREQFSLAVIVCMSILVQPIQVWSDIIGYITYDVTHLSAPEN